MTKSYRIRCEIFRDIIAENAEDALGSLFMEESDRDIVVELVNSADIESIEYLHSKDGEDER